MTQPMFLTDLEGLKKELRLTGIDDRQDIQAILQTATLQFRVEFTHRIGKTIADELEALPFTDPPVTQDDFRRAASRLLEIRWIWCKLVELLPTMLADGSGAAFQEFNDAGIWRQMEEDDRRRLLRACHNEIEELYQMVLPEESLGDDTTILAFDGTGDCPDTYFPGGSVFRHIGKFRGNFVIAAIRFDDVRVQLDEEGT